MPNDPVADILALPVPRRPVMVDTAQPKALWRHKGGWSEADIPPRRWIVPRYLMRGSVSLIAGPGSAGKSSLIKAWMVALAFGQPFSRFQVTTPMKVLSYNVEDNLQEEQRRTSSTLRQFHRTSEEIPDTLQFIGPTHIGVLVQRDAVTGFVVNQPAMDELIAILDEFRPDVLILDPLVELHTADENDNTGIRAVIATFRALAVQYDCAILIAHHVRKGTLSPGEPDGIRGGGSIVGAVRSAFTLLPMTEEEAGRLNVDPKRRRWYFRLDDAKQNYAPIEDAEWFQRQVYTLGNDEEVVAAEPWQPPSPWDGLTWPMIDAILDRINAGLTDGRHYVLSRQAKDRWVGAVVMDVAGKSDGQAATIVRKWHEEGVLYTNTARNPVIRKDEVVVLADTAKMATMRAGGDA